ncbi:MAG: DAK2 domain-containing protein [Bulleidia sp.]|nr:DAK2 domain-containing protein [Bulleidia sp.]
MDKLNGSVFLGMLESGCANLNNRQEEVNSLNVFPVPDGDTGTNMSLTFTSGMSEVRKSGSRDLAVITKTLARGMLMGARGNSGVILSQIFRGVDASVKAAATDEITVAQFSAAFLNGAVKAYKAVMRPTEGTILTVAREASEYGDLYVKDHPECTLEEYVDLLCKEAKASLDRTPELLPVLKEARVVDSGGAGLTYIFDGFRAYLEGAPITEGSKEEEKKEEVKANGYCAEFILDLSEQGQHLFAENRFRESLSKLGNNITLINDGGKVKVRMNSLLPGEVLNLGQRYGEFERIQIDNLAFEQHPSILNSTEKKEEPEEEPIEEKEFGIITVCAGDGLVKLFKNYRADIVVSGGQTMNPATEDFTKAISRLPAKHIFILPNNGNIIMAARQAAELTEDKDIIVLETKSVPQGLSACMAFNPEGTVEENKEGMLEAIDHVRSGSVTYAIKDTSVDGRPIHAGDFMGICEKEIRLTDPDKVEAACGLIRSMVDEDSEIITLISGEDAKEEETERIQAFIENNFDVDVDVEKGGQPVYSYLIGVE